MPAFRKSTNLAVLVVLATALTCAGCSVGRYRLQPAFVREDVEPQYRSASFQEIGAPYSPRLVKIDVEYRMWGRKWKTLSRQITPEVVSGLTANRVFVAADKLNEAQAGQLHVVVSQEISGLKFVEVLAKSTLSGLTYTLFPVSANKFYNMEVTYTPLGGEAYTWKCSSPVRTTVGVLGASVQNENTLPLVDALPVLTEGMAANFAQDFARQNPSPQPANPFVATGGEPTSPASISRLPAVEKNASGDASIYTVQPAAATESTPTFVR